MSRGPHSRISRQSAAIEHGNGQAASADIVVVDPELARLASVIADWASEVRRAEVYLYGSRVRGDHEPDSDVDLCFAFPVRDPAIMAWWELNQLTRFALLELKLGERVHARPLKDPVAVQVRRAAFDFERVAHRDRNVTCVWLPKDRLAT
jgi:predicted nucleotidyltransferase